MRCCWNCLTSSQTGPSNVICGYVLTLLLIRRRVLRLDMPTEPIGTTPMDNLGRSPEMMFVYCTKRDSTYSVPAVMPDSARIDEIQQQLSELLIAGRNEGA